MELSFQTTIDIGAHFVKFVAKIRFEQRFVTCFDHFPFFINNYYKKNTWQTVLNCLNLKF